VVSDPTLEVYEAHASRWRADREARVSTSGPESLARACRTSSDRPVVDLGCGPGWHTASLGPDAVAFDGTSAMLAQVPDFAPGARRVQGDLAALPFRRGSLGGAHASKSYVHLPQSAVPLAFADLHRALTPEAPAELVLFEGDREHDPFDGDEFPGRRFSLWPEQRLRDVLIGAGFAIERFDRIAKDHVDYFRVRVARARSLADSVGPRMRLLVCGLNPSEYAADRGVAFARPGNRFWPAAREAGLVTVDRDPYDALRSHGVGLTDLVKRATTASADLTADEYREGFDRVTRLVEWLRPAAVCFVGLEGWRLAVDRQATAGWQPVSVGRTPVYVMPSTSGLNTHSRLDDLTTHLRQAAAPAQ
jgi:TDG/mug DNA glycosylase family protein